MDENMKIVPITIERKKHSRYGKHSRIWEIVPPRIQINPQIKSPNNNYIMYEKKTRPNKNVQTQNGSI